MAKVEETIDHIKGSAQAGGGYIVKAETQDAIAEAILIPRNCESCLYYSADERCVHPDAVCGFDMLTGKISFAGCRFMRAAKVHSERDIAGDRCLTKAYHWAPKRAELTAWQRFVRWIKREGVRPLTPDYSLRVAESVAKWTEPSACQD
jgi:hypothetical protein